MNFHMISSVLKSGKLQLFFNWINFSQWSSDVSVSDCFAQNNLVNYICWFPVTNICCCIKSSILFYSSWIWHSDCDVWCVAWGTNSQRKSCSLFSSFVFQFVSVIVRSFINGLSHAFFWCTVWTIPITPRKCRFFSRLLLFHQDTGSVFCLRSCFLGKIRNGKFSVKLVTRRPASTGIFFAGTQIFWSTFFHS